VKQIQKINQLETLSYFGVDTISQITDLEGNNLYKNITRWVKQGRLMQLKKGLYTTNRYYNQLTTKNSYLEFISNKLRYPSYLSLEYVLTKNQVLTESVFVYTSISQKTTRSYTNNFGTFTYRTISNALFTGFTIIQKEGFAIAIATKAKALFDYLYLKLYREALITQQMLVELRLNLDEFTAADIQNFSNFCGLSGIKKYKKLPKLLFANHDN